MYCDGRLFILWPTVIKWFGASFAVCNWRGTFNGRFFFPHPKVFQDLADDLGLGNEADDLHFVTALGAGQRIYFPNLFYTLPPMR